MLYGSIGSMRRSGRPVSRPRCSSSQKAFPARLPPRRLPLGRSRSQQMPRPLASRECLPARCRPVGPPWGKPRGVPTNPIPRRHKAIRLSSSPIPRRHKAIGLSSSPAPRRHEAIGLLGFPVTFRHEAFGLPGTRRIRAQVPSTPGCLQFAAIHSTAPPYTPQLNRNQFSPGLWAETLRLRFVTAT